MKPDPATILQVLQRERAAEPDAILAIPISRSLLDDQLTPVLAYRRLVARDDRSAPSFLFESVEGGERQGRYSILGAQPDRMVTARRHESLMRFPNTCVVVGGDASNPFDALRRGALTPRLVGLQESGVAHLPFVGGWVGYASYDSARYAEPAKLAWERAPRDDRELPDVSFACYPGAVVFDHVRKLVHVVELALCHPQHTPETAVASAARRLESRVELLRGRAELTRPGEMPVGAASREPTSNMTRQDHARMVARAKEYIAAGDIFQVVLGQRFERASRVDPFDVYRMLRVINPSPYMVYMQSEGCILVASSPEILCRVRREGDGLVLTSRPLAGTRRRGATPEEDRVLERELLADPKERAEHVMLVDLARNDVGRVCHPGTIQLPRVMDVERYSHVMHISSTVTGRLRDGLDAWDALGASLPVGTVSGAPKVRAMQIIDELEPVRRGPYGGGMGYVGFDGQMDIALALRTIVVPMRRSEQTGWTYHLQASGGIVADSDVNDEYAETVNKAAAMARAIDAAEAAFGATSPR